MYQKGKTYTADADYGIWMDYSDHVWYFMIKDKVWTPEEIRRTEHSDITICFVQKGIVDAFLLSIFDCLEPSDIPFSVIDGDAALKKSLRDQEPYAWQIVLIDETNRIDAVRDGKFADQNTKLLKQALKKRLTEQFDDAALDQAIDKLEKRYQPYELEQFALFTQKN